jgi:hypothetical protein
VKKRYWVVENKRERKKQKRVKGKQTDRLIEKLTKANKNKAWKKCKKKKKKKRERDLHQVGELETQKSTPRSCSFTGCG